MTSKTVFTRYLYNKQEVAVALLTSILQKKRQQSLFWAYELYYSGFEEELFAFLWKIYDQFFCMTNPNFRKYFLKKEKERARENKERENKERENKERERENKEEIKNKDTIVADIVQNLVNRTFTFDVFLLIQIVTQFEIETDGPMDLSVMFQEKEKEPHYLHIANIIMNGSTTIEETTNIIFKQATPAKRYIPSSKEQLVAITMSLFYSHENETNESKIYIKTKEEAIQSFQTLSISPTLKNYKLLLKAYQYAIDEDRMLSLFSLNRDPDFREKYYYHWEYYASFSPVWQQRIEIYKGRVNHETKKVEFEFEDGFEDGHENQESFYNQYNYEPDEQSKETQEKSIGSILKKRTWLEMYNTFEKEKRKELFVPDIEYLEELDVAIFNMS